MAGEGGELGSGLSVPREVLRRLALSEEAIAARVFEHRALTRVTPRRGEVRRREVSLASGHDELD
jgi:hypothetical protein